MAVVLNMSGNEIILQTFCCGVFNNNFDMNMRCEINSSQAKENPGARDGRRAWKTVLRKNTNTAIK